jgi:hypothetical protein
MLELLVVWAALLIVLIAFAIGPPGKGGALTLTYFLALSLVHVPGVLPFIDPAWGLTDQDETLIGFELTELGMAAFVTGAVTARRIDRRRTLASTAQPRWRKQVFEGLGHRILVFGFVAHFLLLPLSSKVPSLTSIVAPVATLLIPGFWLLFYRGVVTADRRLTLVTLALLPLLPLATLVTGGFLGYGVNWDLGILAFLFVISRRRIWFYLSAPLAGFLGLSLFVTYMGERDAIRDVLQQAQAGMFDRIDRASALVTNFQLLDLTSPRHVIALDNRLNQNSLVGLGVISHENDGMPFVYGATIPLWALIPRAVWPGKPEVGGGGSVVSDFTGFKVAEGTSIGPGQVLEFYINFGIPGVLIGFFGLGYLLLWLDQGIMHSLATNDMHGLLLRVMPGLMLINPQGNLLEILVGCVAAYFTARLVIWMRLFHAPMEMRSRGRVRLDLYGPASRGPRRSGP